MTPSTETAVTTAQFWRALTAVRGSELLSRVEAMMATKFGPDRILSWETVLVLYLLTAQAKSGRMIHADVVRFASGLTPWQRRELGLEKTFVAYWLVEGAITDLERKLSKPQLDKTTGELVQDQDSIDDLLSLLLTVFIPQEITSVTPTECAIDSTDFETWACRQVWGTPDVVDNPADLDDGRGVERGEHIRSSGGFPKMGPDGRWQKCKDPDAREGYRAGKNLAHKLPFLGDDVHTAVPIAPVGSNDAWPNIIMAMVSVPAGSEKAAAGLRVIRCLIRRLMGPSRVLADRGYTYQLANKWAVPLRELGIDKAQDLAKNQRGLRPGPCPGTFYLDGTLFSEAMPKALRTLPSPSQGMTSTARVELQREYDKRAPYAFTECGSASGLKQTFRGPALVGRLRCVNNPQSMEIPAANAPLSNCELGKPCGCSKKMTIDNDPEQVRLHQHHIYGGTDWANDYYRRNQVETANAQLKTHHEALSRQSIQVRGNMRRAIMWAFKVAVVNLRSLESKIATGWTPPDETPKPNVRRTQIRQLLDAARSAARRGPPRQ